MVGTIGGLGIWLALLLKTAFALVGMSAYIQLFLPAETSDSVYTVIALGLVVFFGGLNILGAKKTTSFQIVLVVMLLALLGWFLTAGSLEIKPANFSNFLGEGSGNILSAAGLVFISYVGVTKVISVAGEIKNPERNLPLGLFLAIGTAITVYIVGLTVMVGVSGTEGIIYNIDGEINLTPVSTVASDITGSSTGGFIMAIAAIFAFLSVANAGILSASRYPLAMSRDHLLPPLLRKVDGKGTPIIGIIVSASFIILVILFLDPLKIAKLASSFQLLMFALLCISVIVMREAKLDSYDPGFRAPFYPWLQIVGTLSCISIIGVMGWLPIIFSSGIVVAGIMWYFIYARKRVDRYGAIYHIFERLGRKRFVALDAELRGILKEKGLRAHDPFDEIVAKSRVIDAPKGASFEDIVASASQELASLLPATATALSDGFLEGTRVGATPVTGGVALPHLRVPDIEQPIMIIVRSLDGITITIGDVFGGNHAEQAIHALFFLVSPESDPSQHLRLLAQLAGHVDQQGFMPRWLAATTNQKMKEILLREDRFASLRIEIGTSTESLINLPIHKLGFPEGCLVALIHRRGHMVVPRGSTILEEGDQLTIIGDERGTRSLKERFKMIYSDND
jgi:amino acid transporter/mannitol/fructose-specific phosphotransferase system IIA component (Ntr-type)